MVATELPAERAARLTRKRDALRPAWYGLPYSIEWAQAGIRAGGAQYARALEIERLVTRQCYILLAYKLRGLAGHQYLPYRCLLRFG